MDVILHFWKKLSDRILPASEKESMDKTQEWAMKRWRKNRTSSEFLRQQQQKMTKNFYKKLSKESKKNIFPSYFA